MAQNEAYTEKEMSEQEARAVLALAKAKRARDAAEGSRIIWVKNMRTGITQPCTMEAFKIMRDSKNFEDELYQLNADETEREEQKVAEGRYTAARDAYDAAEELLKELRTSGASTAQILAKKREMAKYEAVMAEYRERLGIEPEPEKRKRSRKSESAEASVS